MTGIEGRKTARNRIKPSTTTTSSDQHPLKLHTRKSLQNERNKDKQLRILDINFILLGFIIITSLVALLFIFRSIQFSDDNHHLPSPRVITPFPAPKIMDLHMVYLR